MMKILLATDGSEYSFAAAKRCSEMIAIDDDTEIKLLCVALKITPTMRFEDSDEYLAIAKKASLGVAEDVVRETRRMLEKELGEKQANIETKAVIGYEKETILEEAENWGADLIIVGSHGRGFWGRMLLGSISDAVVRHAKCSVLVVRADEPEVEK